MAQQTAEPKTFLPVPNGKYTIGTTSFFLTDSLHRDRYDRSKKYKLLHLKIWYPSDSTADVSDYNLYLKDYDLAEIYNNFKTKGVTMEEITDMSKCRTNSAEALPVSDSKESFPVILFTPGYYFGLSDVYSSYIENLASNGFIVCSIIHVHQQVSVKGENGMPTDLHKAKSALAFSQWMLADMGTFRDPHKPENQKKLTYYYLKHLKRFDRKIDEWQSSILYALDHLKQLKKEQPHSVYGKFDFNNIGALGQSYGGALSNHMCVSVDEIKAAASMDCIQFGDVIDSHTTKPLMLIESEQYFKWRLGNEYVYRNYSQLEYLKMKGGLHFLFSDLPYFDIILKKEKIQGLIGDIEGKKAVEMINATLLNFFNRHLKNIESCSNFDYSDNDLFLYQKTNKCIFLK